MVEVLRTGAAEPTWRLVGELDMASVRDLRAAFEPVLLGRDIVRSMVLDLSGLTFIDSSGVRALVDLAGAPGCIHLVLAHPDPPVEKVLRLIGLEAHPRIDIQP